MLPCVRDAAPVLPPCYFRHAAIALRYCCRHAAADTLICLPIAMLFRWPRLLMRHYAIFAGATCFSPFTPPPLAETFRHSIAPLRLRRCLPPYAADLPPLPFAADDAAMPRFDYFQPLFRHCAAERLRHISLTPPAADAFHAVLICRFRRCQPRHDTLPPPRRRCFFAILRHFRRHCRHIFAG